MSMARSSESRKEPGQSLPQEHETEAGVVLSLNAPGKSKTGSRGPAKAGTAAVLTIPPVMESTLPPPPRCIGLEARTNSVGPEYFHEPDRIGLALPTIHLSGDVHINYSCTTLGTNYHRMPHDGSNAALPN